MKAHGGDVDARVHIFTATELGEVGWLVLRSTAFTPGEIPRFSFYRGLSGPQGQSGHKGVKKISTPPTPGIEPGPSSPQPSALPLEPPGP